MTNNRTKPIQPGDKCPNCGQILDGVMSKNSTWEVCSICGWAETIEVKSNKLKGESHASQ